jgi:nucleotide-binding universal stress UspA family protein
MKRIIVPTDFSKCADNAIQYAIQIAMLLEAKLEIVYVHRPDVIITEGQMVYVEIPDSKFRNMSELEKELNNYPLLKYQTHINRDSTLYGNILALAKKNGAFMVIMGTEGAFFDSNTSQMIEKKQVPVLAIPERFKGKLEQNAEFIFATDFKDINDWEIMNAFKILAQKLKAKINVFHVNEHIEDKDVKANENFIFHDLKAYFEGLSVTLHHSHKKDVIEAVESFASDHKASLIMMIAHDRSWLSDLFHSSVTKEMSLHAQVPFLSLPDKRAEINKAATISYW